MNFKLYAKNGFKSCWRFLHSNATIISAIGTVAGALFTALAWYNIYQSNENYNTAFSSLSTIAEQMVRGNDSISSQLKVMNKILEQFEANSVFQKKLSKAQKPILQFYISENDDEIIIESGDDRIANDVQLTTLDKDCIVVTKLKQNVTPDVSAKFRITRNSLNKECRFILKYSDNVGNNYVKKFHINNGNVVIESDE